LPGTFLFRGRLCSIRKFIQAETRTNIKLEIRKLFLL
jgi:hypothetical protein